MHHLAFAISKLPMKPKYVHERMTQELRIQMQPTNNWFLVFCQISLKNHKILVFSYFEKCECWHQFLFLTQKKVFRVVKLYSLTQEITSFDKHNDFFLTKR